MAAKNLTLCDHQDAKMVCNRVVRENIGDMMDATQIEPGETYGSFQNQTLRELRER